MQAQTDAICAKCPVQPSCLTWALLEGDLHQGRMAGTGAGDRRRYRQAWNVRAPMLPSVEGVITPLIQALALRREQAAAAAASDPV